MWDGLLWKLRNCMERMRKYLNTPKISWKTKWSFTGRQGNRWERTEVTRWWSSVIPERMFLRWHDCYPEGDGLPLATIGKLLDSDWTWYWKTEQFVFLFNGHPKPPSLSNSRHMEVSLVNKQLAVVVWLPFALSLNYLIPTPPFNQCELRLSSYRLPMIKIFALMEEILQW